MKGTLGLKKGSVPFRNDLETTLVPTKLSSHHLYVQDKFEHITSLNTEYTVFVLFGVPL